ncbi:MFS transporter [Bartonella phoceensis]|uniref:MFS transporter n=1 Tax=Bartonella phoceensis TaxID=270249 RepID=UPI001FEADEF5|nr:MFS transporter [Bartonella phoceensis]
MLDIIAVAIISHVLPEYFAQLTGKDISASSVARGKLLVAYSAMQFLFAPIISNFSDRYGRRPLLLISIVSFALDNFICAIAWSYSMLFIGRLLSGVSGVSFATCMAYLADMSNDKIRTRNFGLLGIASGLGFILGLFLGGFLGQFGSRVPFYFAVGFSLINFSFSWIMLPETLSRWNRRIFDIKRANPLGAFLQFRKYPQVLWVLLVFFLYWFAESVWLSIWSFIAKERYNWSILSIGVSYTVFGIGQIVVVALVLPYFLRDGIIGVLPWWGLYLHQLLCLVTRLQCKGGWFIWFLHVQCLNTFFMHLYAPSLQHRCRKMYKRTPGSNDLYCFIEFNIWATFLYASLRTIYS